MTKIIMNEEKNSDNGISDEILQKTSSCSAFSHAHSSLFLFSNYFIPFYIKTSISWLIENKMWNICSICSSRTHSVDDIQICVQTFFLRFLFIAINYFRMLKHDKNMSEEITTEFSIVFVE